MPPKSPYEDTSVPVSRSQGAIEKLLSEAGALGVRFNQGRFQRFGVDPDALEPCVVEFIWPVTNGQQIVRIQVTPLEPTKPGWSSRSTKQWLVSPEQRERQAWRGLYWYLEGTIKAAQFGLIRFEDIFLSFIVAGDAPDAPTVGELMVEHLQAGGRAIGLLESPETLEGEIV